MLFALFFLFVKQGEKQVLLLMRIILVVHCYL